MAWMLAFSNTSEGVIIITDEGEKIRGFLVSADAAQVVVEVILPGGKREKQVFSAEDAVITVDEERLSKLSSDNPRGYRDYADELFEKVEDPDVQETALRLYLITAYLDPENQGRTCLLYMSDLARNVEDLSPDLEQRRRYIAMAYLLDPEKDRSVFSDSRRDSPRATLDSSQREKLRRGLQALWSGSKRNVTISADDPEFRQALSHFSDILTLEDYKEAVRPDGWVSPSTMRKALTIELSTSPVRSRMLDTVDDGDENESWAARNWKRPANSTAPLRLEEITPFDPRKTMYRNGKWVVPKSVRGE